MSNVKWPEEVWLNTEEFYVKALRFVVRHQKPAYWLRTSSHPAVTGTVRFLRGVCVELTPAF